MTPFTSGPSTASWSIKMMLCVIVIIFMSACVFAIPDTLESNPAATSISSNTSTLSLPSPTPTRSPTLTFRPTPFPTPAEFISGENERITSEMGGISLIPPAGYEITLDGNMILINGEQFELQMMGFISAEYAEAIHAYSPLEALQAYIEYMLPEESSRIQFHNIHAETIDGNVGNSFEMSGVYGGREIGGEALVILRNEQEVLIGFAFTDRHQWQNAGHLVFEDLLSSIDFIHVTPCTVAIDPYYGYTQDRPIAISGGEIGGHYLEQAYLENLRGENGARVQFEFLGTVEYQGHTLDSFSLDYLGLGAPLTLYFDAYSYTQPKAPAGFLCRGDFEFGESPTEDEIFSPLDDGLNF
ncbi:MAG TPA: hypothetical protein VN376_08630 [Longilinea sp.]|nr:hypothetical protein [Longilinea sp.]